jgi:hypothetical protein
VDGEKGKVARYFNDKQALGVFFLKRGFSED